MMMWGFDTPDIARHNLTTEEHHQEHAPYTEETVNRPSLRESMRHCEPIPERGEGMAGRGNLA